MVEWHFAAPELAIESEGAVDGPLGPALVVGGVGPDSAVIEPGEAPNEPGKGDAGAPADTVAPEVAVLRDELVREHERAAHRESVIDRLHAELERLRAGERRSLLRPLLVELVRLRNDLLRQAETLPEAFDAVQAAKLLRSYADTVELALDENGVVLIAPGEGETFNPRVHRRIGDVPALDPARVGLVAGLVRDGYLDVELERAVAPAEVRVYVAASAEPTRDNGTGLHAGRTDRALGESSPLERDLTGQATVLEPQQVAGKDEL